jgi:hypothetical protein
MLFGAGGNGAKGGGAAGADAAVAAAAAGSPWLSLLFDGSPGSCKAVVDLADPLGGLKGGGGESGGDDDGSSSGGGEASSGGGAKRGRGGDAGGAKRARQALRRRVARVAAFNAFGDKHQDLALAAMAREAGSSTGEAPLACVGVWPEFALLNHSCAPNAVNFPVHLAGARCMVVRAARDILQGACWRQPGEGSPGWVRQARGRGRVGPDAHPAAVLSGSPRCPTCMTPLPRPRARR